MRGRWDPVNEAIHPALSCITLADMQGPHAARLPRAAPAFAAARRRIGLHACRYRNARTVQSVTQSGYKWGWETDDRDGFAPKGLNEDIIRLISSRKEEPDWMLDWRLKAYAGLADDGRSRTGRGSNTRRSTTRTCITTPRRRRSPGRRAWTRSILNC